VDIDYLLECAWRDTGTAKFLFDPDDNLTGDLLSVEALRGRDFDSAVGRWTPGQLNAILRNDDGKYSPNNALSPLAGYLKTGRPITLSAGLRESSLAAKFVAADARHLWHADDLLLSVGDSYWDMVAWVKPNNAAVKQTAVFKGNRFDDLFEYGLYLEGSKAILSLRDAADTTTTTVTATSFGDLPSGVWSMIHVYHNPITNKIGIGVNAGTHDTAATAGGVRDFTYNFLVGVGLFLPAVVCRFDGLIGPLAIWKPRNTNLTAAQLTWLYNGGYGRDLSELGVDGTDGQYLIYDVTGVAFLLPWWQMDEVSGMRIESLGLAVALTESGGTISSEAGLNTKVFHGLWSGVINTIQPSAPVVGALHTVALKGIGPLAGLNVAKQLNLDVQSQLTGGWLTDIIDAYTAYWYLPYLDWDTGKTLTGMCYFDNSLPSLELVRQLEDCEPGLLYEFLTVMPDSLRYFWADGFLFGFTDRWHRLTATRSLVPQATFSDAPGGGLSITGLEQLDPLNGIYNSVQVTVLADATVGGAAVLWSLAEDIPLAPWEKRYFTAVYSDAEGVYVNPWLDPVAGVDVKTDFPGLDNELEIGDIVKSANEMTFSVKNLYLHLPDCVVTTIQAQGTPWTKNVPTLISAEDAASIAAYGLRAYPLPPLWLANITDAQNFCNYIVSRYCLPHNRLRMTFVANRDVASMHQTLTGLIGDRITIEADGASGLGIHEDFYIESICHQMGQGKIPHTVVYELVSCSGEGAYAIVDYSPLEYDLAHPTYPTSRLEY